ncbi:hypothetical protein CDD83_1103 [Cordyceps sp. RAO-2017]|nr:hypothetical protein CDD83_1103 [Cordyceps sp. RAO-2017]
MHLLRWSLVFAPRLVASLCAVETDFTKTGDVLDERDWVRQQFNVSAKAGRGRYGKTFSVSNISPHGSARLGVAEQGIELRVNGAPKNDAVPGAEMDSARVDMHWGSYRAGLKLTAVRGTCAAFFWYFNDTQEIDMEFLSQLYDAGRQLYPVNLVVQSRKSMEAGYDASRTETFRRVNLSFDPTAGFHEYRFDYLPGRVVFYADSVKLAVMQGEEIPTNGGHLILQHWSNGDPMWSGGPPTQDALLLVSYVKAYFNSSQEDGSGQ